MFKALALVAWCFLFGPTNIRVTEGRNAELDVHIPLKIGFCSDVKQVRSTFNSIDGVDYVYKDAVKQVMTRVRVRHDFMADRFEEMHYDGFEFFFATGAWIPPLGMWLQVGVSRMQIAGHFENHAELFDLSYAVYFSDHLEEYFRREMVYYYDNVCYLGACMSTIESFYRVFKLGFCRDTYAVYFFPLNSPCYYYNGTTKGEHITDLFEYGEVVPSCAHKLKTYSVKPKFCTEEERQHSYPQLNTLFPHQFSARSKGGLFRVLVWVRDTLYWLENRPRLRYRYLKGLDRLTKKEVRRGNFSEKWQEGKINETAEGKEGKLSERFYFAGAFVYPQYGNHLDRVYFLLLPRVNLTAETEPVYRRALTMLPLTFHPKIYTLDMIIGRNCSSWLSHLLPSKSFHHHMFAIILVSFLVFFLLLVTLFTCDFTGKRGFLAGTSTATAASDALSDHEQSVLLDEMRKK